MKPVIFAVLTALVLSSCAPSLAEKMLDSGQPAGAFMPDTLSFELRRGFIVVRAKANAGDMPLDFILDSGSPVTALSPSTLSYLGLTAPDDGLQLLDSVRLGRALALNVAAEARTYPRYSPVKCIAEAGILGANFMRHFNWVFDFEKQELIVTPLQQVPGPATEPAHRLPFRADRYSGLPVLKGQSGPTGKARFVIGLGQGLGLRLSAAAPPPGAVRVYDSQIRNPYAQAAEVGYHLPEAALSAGSLQWSGTASLSADGANAIGNEIWANYRVGLRFSTGELLLWEASSATALPPLPALGWLPLFDPMGGVTVGLVVEGSPAWQAGMRTGDAVLQVGRTAAPGLYNDFCTYFFGVEADYAARRSVLVKTAKMAAPVQLQLEN
ncbi:hypothetical protein [Phaeodactylibacter luteus]|uniref:PDZ domain-containing protein n=1 Tax=Phaeodactylibacter luteus TaxID=1564516 RepID=A0A5C6RJK9_9BACT|nr:hypothetical protein [Phaeodactylibacter luteus]TXB62124.1 hypothetical protein FRY97_15530 [Phaeodactylibacter luteus]